MEKERDGKREGKGEREWNDDDLMNLCNRNTVSLFRLLNFKDVHRAGKQVKGTQKKQHTFNNKT